MPRSSSTARNNGQCPTVTLPTISLCSMFFFSIGAASPLGKFLPILLSSDSDSDSAGLDLSSSTIGVVLSVNSLLGLLSSVALGRVVDAATAKSDPSASTSASTSTASSSASTSTSKTRPYLRLILALNALSMGCCAVLSLGVVQSSRYLLVAFVFLLNSLGGSSLVDTLGVVHTSATENDKNDRGSNGNYGFYRIFGTLGWGSISFVAGLLVDRIGLVSLFWVTAGCLTLIDDFKFFNQFKNAPPAKHVCLSRCHASFMVHLHI